MADINKDLLEPADSGINATVVADGVPVTSNSFGVRSRDSLTATVYVTKQTGTKIVVEALYAPKAGAAAALFTAPFTGATAAGVETVSKHRQEYDISGELAGAVCGGPFKFKNVDMVEAKVRVEVEGGTTDVADVYVVIDG